MTGGLAPVGQRLLDMLWNSMTKLTEDEDILSVREEQEVFCVKRSEDFVGREKVLDNLVRNLESCEEGIIHLSGAPGSGSTSLLAKVYCAASRLKRIRSRLHGVNVLLPCFIDALPKKDDESGSAETQMLLYIFEQLMKSFGLSGSASDTENMATRNKR